MRQLIKRILFPFLSRWYKRRSRKTRRYSKHGVTLSIFPGVFHPGLFFSTNILLEMLDQLDLKGKYFLELGAGSGMVAFYAWKRGANVTASDISSQALKGLETNAKNLDANITIVYSDLFENTSLEAYDLIVINPPYYPKNPSNEEEMAFYCGDNFDYFRRLFSQLSGKTTADIRMILSQDCDLVAISTIARENRLKLVPVYRKTVWFEKNTVFSIQPLETT